MRLYEYQSSRSFIDFGPIQSDSIILNFFSSITADLTYPQHSGERDRTNDPLFFFNVTLSYIYRHKIKLSLNSPFCRRKQILKADILMKRRLKLVILMQGLGKI